ncbi:MAG: hypothetical protein R2856_29110 [Caldilineaceae bacterium]
MKLITPGVVDLINMANEGNFPGGNYVGEVGLAPSTTSKTASRKN